MYLISNREGSAHDRSISIYVVTIIIRYTGEDPLFQIIEIKIFPVASLDTDSYYMKSERNCLYLCIV